ncbi:hypothetical protein PPL_04742 [Heterostelium album PN500]|uniref:Uncharacterized protein n=1 Tax=Heterostelium pallidum (strain ATCC 26659 / Pp 5 / PN500) TaxID=670386 RepID=D3B8E9_HETP5|nr:hypothetical protein PPL_04742 [Heterostelium album PN500]EFA82317.1 hypothetical protein PPL_04742 [Heterostelium album PN500]|eukprot:XP_020434434.1 hypothetical protein PPL_04742 [Heterostelium album PN500]
MLLKLLFNTVPKDFVYPCRINRINSTPECHIGPTGKPVCKACALKIIKQKRRSRYQNILAGVPENSTIYN